MQLGGFRVELRQSVGWSSISIHNFGDGVGNKATNGAIAWQAGRRIYADGFIAKEAVHFYKARVRHARFCEVSFGNLNVVANAEIAGGAGPGQLRIGARQELHEEPCCDFGFGSSGQDRLAGHE